MKEDGIVLEIDGINAGAGVCVSAAARAKIYFNWKSGKSEVHICYPRIESGQPTVCSETCVGRIRYLGVLLYDADGIEEAASTGTRQICMNVEGAMCFSIRTIRRSLKRRLTDIRKTSSTP